LDGSAGRDEASTEDDLEVLRPPEVDAACVHADEYGTRSALVVRVGREIGVPPRVMVSDGPSCSAPFVDVTPQWSSIPLEAVADQP
jgi:hypothetical protein